LERPGEGAGGSDRIVFTWGDRAIESGWLQVTVPAGGRVGLAADDVFYFGNALGDTGDRNSAVNATDLVRTRVSRHGDQVVGLIDNPFDFNRDRMVAGSDQFIVNNFNYSLAHNLRLISPPASVITGLNGELTSEGEEPIKLLQSEVLNVPLSGPRSSEKSASDATPTVFEGDDLTLADEALDQLVASMAIGSTLPAADQWAYDLAMAEPEPDWLVEDLLPAT
jgi:hypothetical protein